MDNYTNLSKLSLSNSGFIFDKHTGSSYFTNCIGIEIINMINKQYSINDIANNIAEQFSLDKKTIDADLTDFINNMRFLGIL